MPATSADTLRVEILKRIAPGFRHKVLGNMQPIALLSQLVSKKIEANQKESEYLLGCLQEIKASLKIASRTIDDLFTWLNPQDTSLPLNTVVEGCLDLLKMEIHASNVSFVNDIQSTTLVEVSTIRYIVSACLLTYIDTVEKASQVVISERAEAAELTIEMKIAPVPDKQDKPPHGHATFLDWQDVGLLRENISFVAENDRVLISRIV